MSSSFVIQSLTDVCTQVDQEHAEIKAGARPVGPWRVRPSDRTIQHARAGHLEIDLDRVTSPQQGVGAVARMAGKQSVTDADVGALVRLLRTLGLFPAY